MSDNKSTAGVPRAEFCVSISARKGVRECDILGGEGPRGGLVRVVYRQQNNKATIGANKLFQFVLNCIYIYMYLYVYIYIYIYIPFRY